METMTHILHVVGARPNFIKAAPVLRALARAKSVRTKPGAIQLARMPRGPHSTARLRVSCMSAAFDTP